MARPIKGRLFKRGKSGSYYLQYYVNGKEHKKALRDKDGDLITNEREAEKARDIIIKPYAAKDEVQLRKQAVDALKFAEEKAEDAEELLKQHVTIANGWQEFFDSQTRRDTGPDTLINYSRHYSKFQDWLKDKYPDIKYLKDITPAIASKFAVYIKTCDFSKNTINKYNGFLKLFFNVLIKDEKLDNNPFQEIQRLKQKSNSRKELTKEQVYTLLTTATGELALLIGMGYFTGLRRGDCCTLLWDEVDMDKGIINRIPNKIKDRSEDPESVKIGINEHLYNALTAIPPEKRNVYVLPQMAEYYNNSKRDRINRQIRSIFQKCGINTAKAGTGTELKEDEQGNKIKISTGKRAIVEHGFHSLRYSYISHHAEAGTPQAVIQKNAGHKNPAMTDHYTKISDNAAIKTSNVLTLMVSKPTIAIPEPEREKLAELVKLLPIEKIKELLTIAEKK
jgi:integrase